MKKIPRQSANNLLFFQGLVAVIFSIVLLPWGLRATYSALLAGGICALANWFFLRRLFRRSVASAAKTIVKDFYFGELMKLGIVAIGMLISMVIFRIRFLPFFLTYVLLQFAILFAPLRFLPTREVRA